MLKSAKGTTLYQQVEIFAILRIAFPAPWTDWREISHGQADPLTPWSRQISSESAQWVAPAGRKWGFSLWVIIIKKYIFILFDKLLENPASYQKTWQSPTLRPLGRRPSDVYSWDIVLTRESPETVFCLHLNFDQDINHLFFVTVVVLLITARLVKKIDSFTHLRCLNRLKNDNVSVRQYITSCSWAQWM